MYVRESLTSDVIGSQLNALETSIAIHGGGDIKVAQHVRFYQPKMIGLANLGNTCFINCVVQFLVHTPFFRQYLLDELYLDRVRAAANNNSNSNNSNGNNTNNQNGGGALLQNNNQGTSQNVGGNQQANNSGNNNNNNNNNGESGGNERSNNQSTSAGTGSGATDLSKKEGDNSSLIRQLALLTKHLKSKPYNDVYDPVRPQNLKRAIDISMPAFSGHEQHDAQEFLNSFLDHLNDEVKVRRLLPVKKVEDVQKTNNQAVNGNVPGLVGNEDGNNAAQNVLLHVQSQPQSVQVAENPNEQQQNNSNGVNNNNNNNVPNHVNAVQVDDQKKESNTQVENQMAGQQQQQQQTTSASTTIATAAAAAAAAPVATPIKQQYQELSIIKDVYMGQTVNKIQCLACSNSNQKIEDFYSLTLPLPPSKGVLYEVTFVPRVSKDHPNRAITKYGIRVSRQATFGDFQHAFEKISKVNLNTVVFAEIYKNSIFRNLFSINPDIPMRNLGIRSYDQIAVFEVITVHQELEVESSSIAPAVVSPTKANIKMGDFVDYQVHSRWMHAHVEEVIAPISPGKEVLLSLRAFEENLRASQYTQRERRESSRVQPFRSMIQFYPREKGFVVFITNRRPHNNSMEKFGLPLCLVVPAWLTWRELHLLVYAQIKRFIDFQYLEKRQEAATKAQQTKQKAKKKKAQGYTRLQGDEFDGVDEDNNNNDFGDGINYMDDAVKSHMQVNHHNFVMLDHSHQQDVNYEEQLPPLQHLPYSHNRYQPKLYSSNNDAQNEPQRQQHQYQSQKQHAQLPQQQQQNSDQNKNNEPRKKAPSFHISADDFVVAGDQGEQDFAHGNHRQTELQKNNLNSNGTSGVKVFQIRTNTHIKYDSSITAAGLDSNQQQQAQFEQKSNINPYTKHQTEGRKSHPIQNQTEASSAAAQQQNQSRKDYFQALHENIKDEADFLASTSCPYRLRVLDQSTQRCAICDLQLFPEGKSVREYCDGCEKGLVDRPIYWDIKQTNMLIAIDWKDSLSVNPSSMVPISHRSYIDLKKEKSEVNKGIPVADCFNIFTTEERVEIECEKCKKKQAHSTQLQLHKLPNILIVHLSRFQFLNGLFEKIDDLVNFPLKRLDVSEWTLKKPLIPNLITEQHPQQDNSIQQNSSLSYHQQQQNQQQSLQSSSKKNAQNESVIGQGNNDIYDLVAVVNHIGNGHGGHYTSYVNISDDQKDCWVHFDDEQVSYIAPNVIVSDKAYLLIYKKKFSTSAIVNLTYKNL